MRPLSNLRPGRDERGGSHVKPIQCRRCSRDEVDPALRMLLADSSGPANDERVLDFLSLTMRRGLSVNDLWIATVDRHIVWTLLPVVNPGRTMLLLSPSYLPPGVGTDAVSALVDAVAAHYLEQGIHLAQLLLEQHCTELVEAYATAGFLHLAELIYLERRVRSASNEPLPEWLRIVNYSNETHALFAKTIQETYQQSLDCPALNGVRDINDVIAGHQAAGDFEPTQWHLMLHDDKPLGVLLLSKTGAGGSLELVYLGLTPEARGQGFADLFMKLALASVPRSGCTTLTLAVDSRNEPALRLYHRHGLRQVAARHAMMRDLRHDQPPQDAASVR